jgi:hypothetical protein
MSSESDGVQAAFAGRDRHIALHNDGHVAPPIARGKPRRDPCLMVGIDSALDREEMARARALLEPPKRPERMWPVLAAASLLALSALTFATAMILAPPLTSEHVSQQRGVK